MLVGPSGCGKSTLLRTLGLEQCDSGSIHFGDRDVTALPPRDRDVAMVFQSYALYPQMTVEGNLAFGLKNAKHTVRLVVLGEPYAGSPGAAVAIDNLVVYR